MDTRVRYLLILAVYVAACVVVGTGVTVHLTDLNGADSFYYVVQTLWTVGFGDVIPAGHVGRVITLALNFFGTIGVLSAIGIVSGIVLDRFVVRQRRLAEDYAHRRERISSAIYEWADENGVERDRVEEAIVFDEVHRRRASEMERGRGRVPGGIDRSVLSSRGMERV